MQGFIKASLNNLPSRHVPDSFSARCDDANVLGDGLRGDGMISGDHDHLFIIIIYYYYILLLLLLLLLLYIYIYIIIINIIIKTYFYN